MLISLLLAVRKGVLAVRMYIHGKQHILLEKVTVNISQI